MIKMSILSFPPSFVRHVALGLSYKTFKADQFVHVIRNQIQLIILFASTSDTNRLST